MNIRQASAVAPPRPHRDLFFSAGTRFAVEADVVETASVAVPPAAVIVTGVVAPNESVGRSCAPAGLEIMAAVNATFPVKLPMEVKVIVEVFPLAAPGAIEIELPLIAKLGLVTVTDAVPVLFV
jgi:hypothetical protein